MRHLFSGYSEQRSESGQLVIQMGARIGFPLIAVLVLPPAAAGFQIFFSWGVPGGAPWFLLWGAIGLSILGAAVLLLIFAPQSRLRVVLDGGKGQLTVESRSGRAELPLRDVSHAEMVSKSAESTPDYSPPSGIVVTIGDTSTTVYRLELVLRSGKRIAASDAYFSGYRDSDRERAIQAINQELRSLGSTAGKAAL